MELSIELYRNSLLENKKEALKLEAEIAIKTIQTFYKEGNNEKTKQAAIAMVKELTFGENGYFWINDYYPRMVMHPFKPALDGTSLKESKDPEGTYLFNEMVKTVKENGAGFVYYMWPKPGFDKPQPKISYVVGFEKWEWIIGTGVYIDDINRLVEVQKDRTRKEIRSLMIKALLLGLSLCLIISLIILFLVKSVVSPLNYMAETITGILKTGDFSKQINLDQKDEIGLVVAGFNRLLKILDSGFKEINRVMRAIRAGDLTNRITADDDSRLDTDSINDAIGMLSHSIIQVMKATEQVNACAGQIASASQALASGTTEQAASLEETSSSMAEVGSRAKINNENANQAVQLSNQTLDIVDRGNAQMEEMLASMNKINHSSADISKIIKVIDEIAFQTNLLALNAAVEAARAGKYGKGFAVVAEEVRNLAARSAEAAKNTTGLIENSVKEVELGVANADKTAEILNEINTSITKVNDLVGEIASSSQEQRFSTDEINKALAQVNSVVQQNSSISEQAAAYSEELSVQAKQLNELMSRFRVNLTEEDLPGSSGIQSVMKLQAPSKKDVNPRKTITLDDDSFGKLNPTTKFN
ncbi:methyl-accepting chemotaxis protein [bacterium]|nr:methyl-accepting chemotaxis protein [bacterium]